MTSEQDDIAIFENRLDLAINVMMPRHGRLGCRMLLDEKGQPADISDLCMEGGDLFGKFARVSEIFLFGPSHNTDCKGSVL